MPFTRDAQNEQAMKLHAMMDEFQSALEQRLGITWVPNPDTSSTAPAMVMVGPEESVELMKTWNDASDILTDYFGQDATLQ